MRRDVMITTEKIDEHALVAARDMSAGMGAAVYFVGVVRGAEDGQPIGGLEYEAFVPMAERQFHLLFDQADARWPIECVRLAHRIGRVNVGEPSLWVEVISPHRDEAFAACQYIISEMKRVVPIWKKPFPLA